MRKASAIFLLALAVLQSGCSTLKVESNPPGGRVVWSRDGLEPYRTWPPNSWELTSRGQGPDTPFSTKGFYGDVLFVSVEKDGYRRPLPKPVQLYPFRREKLAFNLTELPETHDARMKAEGKVLFEGQWVDPTEKGLKEFDGQWFPAAEAFAREQRAKGLVLYKEQWLTPSEAATREGADKSAQGYIEYNKQWVKPEVAEQMKAVDAEVAKLQGEKVYADLPAPKIVGAVTHRDAQVQLYNSTGHPVRFLFSGPLSRSFTLQPYTGRGVRRDDLVVLPPGRYAIAVVPEDRDASGQNLSELLQLDAAAAARIANKSLIGSWPLAGGMEYGINYTGSAQDLQQQLDKFEMPEAEMNFTPPTIEIPEPKATPTPVPGAPGGPGGGAGRQRGGNRSGGGGRPPGGGGAAHP